jgi:hypothetical protein
MTPGRATVPYFPAAGEADRAFVPGEALGLTLRWRAEGRPTDDYHLFVHLRDAAGRVVAGRYAAPQGGTYPTRDWRPGESLLDSADLALPPGLAPGRYTVVIGLEAPGKSRLPVRDRPDGPPLPADELRLGTITVGGAP